MHYHTWPQQGPTRSTEWPWYTLLPLKTAAWVRTASSLFHDCSWLAAAIRQSCMFQTLWIKGCSVDGGRSIVFVFLLPFPFTAAFSSALHEETLISFLFACQPLSTQLPALQRKLQTLAGLMLWLEHSGSASHPQQISLNHSPAVQYTGSKTAQKKKKGFLWHFSTIFKSTYTNAKYYRPKLAILFCINYTSELSRFLSMWRTELFPNSLLLADTFFLFFLNSLSLVLALEFAVLKESKDFINLK